MARAVPISHPWWWLCFVCLAENYWAEDGDDRDLTLDAIVVAHRAALGYDIHQEAPQRAT